MATVQSMTLDRLLALEADTVIGGHIDGAGDLILEQHDGSTINAGSAIPAVPDASTTTKGKVELATQAETLAGSDSVRAVTPASLVGSIDTAKLVDDAVNQNKIADNAVGTAQIIDSNVTTGKLATNAVTTAKISDSNVTTAKIADGSVTLDKLAASLNELIPRGIAYIRPSYGSLSYSNNTTSFTSVGSPAVGTKLSANTRLRIEVSGTAYVSASSVIALLAVRIGSTDYDIAKVGEASSISNAHGGFHGVIWVPSIAAGEVSVQLRAKISPSGTVSIDANDWFFIDVIEMM